MIKSVKLVKFRCFEEINLIFDPKITIVLGCNASGKTSILEGVCCLSLTKSFRTSNFCELVYNQNGYFYLEGEIEKQSKLEKISFFVDKNIKKAKINNFVCPKLSDFFGFFNVVVFSALDFLILKGAANERRKMFDLVLSQISKEYLIVSNYYKKVLKEKNALLKRFKIENNVELLTLLDTLNEQLIYYGNSIIQIREFYVNEISNFACEIHEKITNNGEKLKLKYLPNLIEINDENLNFVKHEEITKGFAVAGPHRDDFEFLINDKNVSSFGSQGQQRNAILSVKLGIAELINKVKKEAPTLLLDDVFSELDKERQNALVSSLNPDFQTIITTASISDLTQDILDKASIVEIERRSE